MAVAVTSIGSLVKASSPASSSVTITLSGGASVGDLVVVLISSNTPSPEPTSYTPWTTDSAGNVWCHPEDYYYDPVDPLNTFQFCPFTVVTSPMSAGGTITIPLNNTTSLSIWEVFKVTGLGWSTTAEFCAFDRQVFAYNNPSADGWWAPAGKYFGDQAGFAPGGAFLQMFTMLRGTARPPQTPADVDLTTAGYQEMADPGTELSATAFGTTRTGLNATTGAGISGVTTWHILPPKMNVYVGERLVDGTYQQYLEGGVLSATFQAWAKWQVCHCGTPLRPLLGVGR